MMGAAYLSDSTVTCHHALQDHNTISDSFLPTIDVRVMNVAKRNAPSTTGLLAEPFL